MKATLDLNKANAALQEGAKFVNSLFMSNRLPQGNFWIKIWELDFLVIVNPSCESKNFVEAFTGAISDCNCKLLRKFGVAYYNRVIARVMEKGTYPNSVYTTRDGVVQVPVLFASTLSGEVSEAIGIQALKRRGNGTNIRPEGPGSSGKWEYGFGLSDQDRFGTSYVHHVKPEVAIVGEIGKYDAAMVGAKKASDNAPRE